MNIFSDKDMKEFNIVDNFLNDDEMHFLKEYFEYKHVWAFGLKSTASSRGTMFKAELKDKPFFNEYLVTKICKEFNLSHVNPDEIHANGQTILNDGTWHHDFLTKYDGSSPPYNQMWTVILYVSDINRDNVEEIQGHTQIRMDDNKIISIEPFKNRLIIFDSSRQHRGLGPSIPGFLRISITFKLKKCDKI
jgi:hypothetical protein|tara:strand:+ start:36 stop:608 length:573 start_codon:yes stop_codon:yes gene_type:complete